MKVWPFVAGAMLCLGSIAAAQQPPRSLDEARASVRKGTAEGIVLIPARKTPEAAQPAASGSTTAVGVPATPGAAPAAPAAAKTSVFGSLFENIRLTNPPSGQSLQAAKRDESAARGIALPVAASASRPASAPR